MLLTCVEGAQSSEISMLMEVWGKKAGVQGLERISGVCWVKKAMLVRCEGCGVASGPEPRLARWHFNPTQGRKEVLVSSTIMMKDEKVITINAHTRGKGGASLGALIIITLLIVVCTCTCGALIIIFLSILYHCHSSAVSAKLAILANAEGQLGCCCQDVQFVSSLFTTTIISSISTVNVTIEE